MLGHTQNNRKLRLGTGLAAGLASLSLALAACGSSGGSSGGGSSSANSPVTIGVNISLTGPIAGIGKIYQSALDYWESQNKTIDGRPVKIDLLDDQGTADGGAQVAREFVYQDKVDAVAGVDLTDVATTELPVLAKANVFTAELSAFQDAENTANYPDVYPMQILDTDQGHLFWNEFSTLGITKVGVLAVNDASGSDFYAAMKATTPANSPTKIVDTEYYPSGATNLTTQVEKLKAAGAQAIALMTTATGEEVAAFTALQTLNWYVKIVGISSIASGAVVSAIPPKTAALGVATGITKDAADPITPAVSAWRTGFLKFTHQTSLSYSIYQAMGLYDALSFIAWAIEGSGSTNTATMTKYVDSHGGWTGLRGTYSYTAGSHEGITPNEVVGVNIATFDNGTYQPVTAGS